MRKPLDITVAAVAVPIPAYLALVMVEAALPTCGGEGISFLTVFSSRAGAEATAAA